MMNLEKTVLGIELGSTRIKAVLIDEKHIPIAQGDFEWENQLVNGIWTYSMDMVRTGIQTCFARLRDDVQAKFGVPLDTVGAIGVSAMMHGYLPFDRDAKQLAEFRTWRNTITGEAAEKLTELFGFNIPQRWSIAHLYQAYLNKEAHVGSIAYLTTLAGYIHWQLTGEKVMGVGEASGMFPIDSGKLDYNEEMVQQFKKLTGISLRDILPKVLPAGESGGTLTEAGARLLDPSGTLRPGIPVAPCEGDAGTGMAATNSVRVKTGNVSAGTSDFAMIVTEKEYAELMGIPANKGEMFVKLFNKALEGDPDCGGLMSFNYFSGEGVTDLDEGRPVFARTPNAKFTLANFMRTHILSALATLKIGLDILTQTEQVPIDKLYGHGGFFKTPLVGQRMLSAAVGAPVSVMETAGEGGPYGMALLSAYMLWKEKGESLADYLDNKVFADARSSTLMAEEADIAGFSAFLERYKKALPMEKKATEVL